MPNSYTVAEKKIGRFQHVTVEFSIPDLPGEFDGYHMLQLTDFHFGPATPAPHLRRAIKLTNDLKPDLILMTGDYVHNDPIGHRHFLATAFSPKLFDWVGYRRSVRQLCEKLADELRPLSPPDGIIGVFGNHDHLEGLHTVRRQLSPVITFLLNETAVIRRGNSRLVIVGVDDYKRGKLDLERALSTMHPRELAESSEASAAIGGSSNKPAAESDAAFKLLLSHNPDITLHRHEKEISRFDLMLCGHTHGGQIRLPFFGALTTRTKQKDHTRGISEFRGVPVYVSSGVGYGLIQLRLNCPPEITSIRLRRAGS